MMRQKVRRKVREIVGGRKDVRGICLGGMNVWLPIQTAMKHHVYVGEETCE